MLQFVGLQINKDRDPTSTRSSTNANKHSQIILDKQQHNSHSLKSRGKKSPLLKANKIEIINQQMETTGDLGQKDRSITLRFKSLPMAALGQPNVSRICL